MHCIQGIAGKLLQNSLHGFVSGRWLKYRYRRLTRVWNYLIWGSRPTLQTRLLVDVDTSPEATQCNKVRQHFFLDCPIRCKTLFNNMQPPSCCVSAPGHRCDLILVYGDTLRALLSSSAVDAAIWNHIALPLDDDMPVMFLCQDDLLGHLGNVTHRDNLEELLALLLDANRENIEAGIENNIDEILDSVFPITMEYGYEGDLFAGSPDFDPPDSKRPLFKIKGAKRKTLQSFVMQVGEKVKEKVSSRLLHDLRRTPSKDPECPHVGKSSTCSKDEENVKK